MSSIEKPSPNRGLQPLGANRGHRVRVEGPLDRSVAASLYRRLLRDRSGQVVLDLGGARAPDAVALAAIVAAARAIAARDGALTIEGAPGVARDVERRLSAPRARKPAGGRPPYYMEWASVRALATTVAEGVADLGRLAVGRARLPRGALSDQIAAMGADGAGIVSLLALLLGMILAFNASAQLTQLGATAYIADVVGLSLVREFAPLLTAIIVIGRSGAAIASELASMTVNQEIDALRTMGISPSSFLVSPRVLGIVLVQPALTLLAMAIGLAGGLATTQAVTDVSPVMFYDRLTDVVSFGDVLYGLEKSVAFAAATGLICCAVGLHTRGGAVQVGRATTRAVVLSIFFLVVIDSIFTFTSETVEL